MVNNVVALWYTFGMRIYLDTCAVQRPLDNKAQMRIILEAEAVLGIIGLCDAGKVDLVSSEVLLYEVERNPQTRVWFGNTFESC